ncbi:hypothetical protein B6N17_019285, partial [Stutzerimonas stutzeri]|uniref:winged helix-turn-helix domain-containing protein n=1 Tax=Stutzerimonas stutzeri TaxID=316 RepID=UPI000A2252DD
GESHLLHRATRRVGSGYFAKSGSLLQSVLIASQVWDMNFDSDTNVIEVAVRRLRAKIDDEFEPKLIQTARGMGYLIEAPDS